MRKMSILFFSFFLVFVFMFTGGCKAPVDITGTWNITYNIVGVPVVGLVTFTGTKESGTVSTILVGDIGTYSVSGDEISFTVEINDSFGDALNLSASGVIRNKNSMDGSFSYYYLRLPQISLSGTWTATR
ncbi:MAG: hypothetical protein ABFR75_10820 [Acidobacteriota bacterium]